MTPRRRAHGALTSGDLPALQSIARGYLHQDVMIDHDNVIGAARAFTTDASPDERRAAIADLRRLVDLSRRWTAKRLERFFRDELGAAWSPRSKGDLLALLDALEPAG
jgi:hypothetical protein